MNRKNIIFTSFLSLLILILVVTANGFLSKNSEIIKVVRFKEDIPVTPNIKGFSIIYYSIKDVKHIPIKRIWITNEFLNDNKNVGNLKYLLEKEYDIFVQGDNVYREDIYNCFNIDESNRMTKMSKNEEIESEMRQKSSPKLHKSGLLIFKNNGNYYTMGNNLENINDISGLLSIFINNDEKARLFPGITYN